MTDTDRTYAFSSSCLLCGRSKDLRLTEAEAARLPPSRCSHEGCKGRMLLTRADLGQRGGAFDPSIPRSVKTRVNHYRSKLGTA